MSKDQAAANNNEAGTGRQKLDPTSDAARTDPKKADAQREDLKKGAEKGFERALDKSPDGKK